MTDASTTDLGIDIPEAPRALTREEHDACAAALTYNVEHGREPLDDLSAQTHDDLMRLAYHNLLALGVLESAIRAKMRERNETEAKAKSFSLGLYRAAAKQTQKRISDYNSTSAKMRQRNLKLLNGGRDPREGTDVPLPEAAFAVRAMAESTSFFLRASALLMELRRGRLWYDDFHGDYFTDWDGKDNEDVVAVRKIDDAWLLRCHAWLLMLDTKLGNFGPPSTTHVIHYVADQDHRNEPRAWLEGLAWDGESRLPRLVSAAYGAPDDAYHQAVGRCWFVSMVARVMWPGCKVDTMPVLFGPQGTYKSTSLQVIGGAWYRSITTSLSKAEDFKLSLLGAMLGEIDELDALSGSKVENSRVKSMLSTSEDVFRPPYGKASKCFRRTIVFVGTTNDAAWHRDETGGRRYWPINCVGNIDLEWLRTNRDQLFAEAMARYLRGESWSDVPRAEQESRVMEHYTSDPWEDRIAAAIAAWGASVYRGPWSAIGAAARAGDPAAREEGAHWGTLITTNRLSVCALGLPTERQSRVTSNRIARAMRRLGWMMQSARIKVGTGSTVTKVWIVTQEAGAEASKQGRLSFEE